MFRLLSFSAVLACSAFLFASCSDDTSANSDIVDVPAKGNVALESSFDFKITKSCAELKGLVLAKTSNVVEYTENEEEYDEFENSEEYQEFLKARYTNENVDFYLNEDGSATVVKEIPMDCGGVNTADYEIVNDTLFVSLHHYIWEKVYDPDLGDSVLVNAGWIQGTCRACHAEFKFTIPPQFVGAKYWDDGLVYNIVYKKR